MSDKLVRLVGHDLASSLREVGAKRILTLASFAEHPEDRESVMRQFEEQSGLFRTIVLNAGCSVTELVRAAEMVDDHVGTGNPDDIARFVSTR